MFSGIDKQKDCIVLAKRKDLQNFKQTYSTLRDAAMAKAANFGFKVVQNELIPDKNVVTEAQVALEMIGAKRCCVVFVNAGCRADIEIIEIQAEQSYFHSKVEDKLKLFFDNHFVRQVAIKNYPLYFNPTGSMK